MNKAIRNIEPKSVWGHFADLNEVPRASKKEEEVIEFMKNFGKSLNLETIEDEIGNVIIKKPASKGMEDRKIIILQSHLDMVHQKNNDTEFDFATEGIKMKIEGDWVKAEGTTLGADNGLGVAAIMTILKSDDIVHPPIEALFTIDEETGMTGAKNLEGKYLDGRILLNLDTEEDDEIGIGCAGGIDVSAEREYKLVDVNTSDFGIKITVQGLNGGHSGMEIHKGLGNSNKILGELLSSIKGGYQIAEVDGGGLRNAIPREAYALISVKDVVAAQREIEEKAWEIKKKLNGIDPDLTVLIDADDDAPAKALTEDDSVNYTQMINDLHNGVYKMSEEMEGLVEASNNLARLILKDGKASVQCLTRSSVEESKMEVANLLKSACEKAGFEVEFAGSYPGWKPNAKSEILKILESKYIETFNEKPNVAACHAGLECGILAERLPGLDMISFGPTILGAHSPDERASISSTQKFWKYLLEILKDSPKK